MKPDPEPNAFQPTRWSLVAQSRSGNSADDGDRAEALEALCRLYWTPLFVFARREGWSPEDSEDLVQSFFAKLLGADGFEAAEEKKGRLRNYLLAGLKSHLIDESRARAAAKRGGHLIAVSVSAVSGEHSGAWQIAHTETPEQAYQHRWICALLEHCLAVLRPRCAERGKSAVFEAFAPLLTPGDGGRIEDAAETLGLGKSTASVALHRFRKTFGEIFRAEIEATLLPGEDVDDEINFLAGILSATGQGGKRLSK